MITLDASVMIAYNYSKDPHHSAALNILDSEVGELFAHPMSVAETLVGAARVGRERELLSLLERVGVRTVRPEQQEPLRLAQLRVSTGLKLPDCCVLSAALSTRSALATFDDALAAAARELGVEVVSAL